MRQSVVMAAATLFLGFSSHAMANPNPLTNRLERVSGKNFISNTWAGCDLHLEADLTSLPSRLTYTWTQVKKHGYGVCEVEGLTQTVTCSDDFTCGGISLLLNGNVTKDGRKYHRQ